MDGRGGCCIARYGGYGGRYSLSKADRIMLRFRPIAPKPANDGGGGGGGGGSPTAGKYGSITTSGGSGSSDGSGKSGRGKRKYQKESLSRRKRSKNSDLVGDDGAVTTAVTLSLLPETPDQKRVFTDLNVSPFVEKRNGPLWLSFSGGGGVVGCGDGMVTPYNTSEISRRTVVVSSCVTVERVTEAWIDGYGLGKSDGERKMNLMRDTCPGFISNGEGIVTWTNDAYRKMAREDINIPPTEGIAPDDNFHVIVRLVMKERPLLTYPAFTCRVRLQYTCRDRERGSVTVPCDVCRMDGGGFAWRLDVKAALCL